MGILHCHYPLTPGNKNTLVQPDINIPPPADKGWHKERGNGQCGEAGDGLKSLTPAAPWLSAGPLWNCSRWKRGQRADIWMTVCLAVGHNHQPSDLVKGKSKRRSVLIGVCLRKWAALTLSLRVFALLFTPPPQLVPPPPTERQTLCCRVGKKKKRLL